MVLSLAEASDIQSVTRALHKECGREGWRHQVDITPFVVACLDRDTNYTSTQYAEIHRYRDNDTSCRYTLRK